VGSLGRRTAPNPLEPPGIRGFHPLNSASFHWIPVATAELWKPLEPSESHKHLRGLRPLFQSCIVDRRLWKPTTAYKRPSPLLYLAFYQASNSHLWRPCRPSLGPGRPDESPAEGTVREDGAHRPGALGQGCKDPKPLRPVRCCSQHAKCSHREQERPYKQNARIMQSAYTTSIYGIISKVQSTFQLINIDNYSYAYNHHKGL